MTHQTHRHRRRHSPICLRHPTSKPTTGFCPTCLHERLSTIESLSSSLPTSNQIPELRRVRSVELEEEGEDFKSFDEETDDGEKKTMKEFIDLESKNQQIKKNNNDKASVLTRTLQRLSLKKQEKEKTNLSRRSCDVDPRLGGISLDEPPRASLDGCLNGKTYPKMIPLSSLTEDAKPGEVEDEKKPGGTAQTRDYYLDSRRRSKQGLLETITNAKVSAESVGLFHGAKLLVTESELRDSNWYSIKNYKPESLELGSVATEVKKTGKKWGNLWGLIQRKTDTTKTEQSLKLGGNAMEGSLAESLLKLRRVAKGGETNGDVSEKLIRSYSVSASRKSCDGGGGGGGSVVKGLEGGRSSCDGLFHGSIETGRRSSFEGKWNHLLERESKLGTQENLRNGMVRFYLTPYDEQLREK